VATPDFDFLFESACPDTSSTKASRTCIESGCRCWSMYPIKDTIGGLESLEPGYWVKIKGFPNYEEL